MGSNQHSGENNFGRQTENEVNLLSEERETNHDLRLIRLFNHYRHDWMNEIQLIFGYVQLKKYDKLESLMGNIRSKVQQESNISKLGIPELIVYLFLVEAEVKELKLEVKMDHEIHINKLPIDCKALGQWLIAVIEVFKRNATLHGDDEHALSVELTQAADKLQVDCVYQSVTISDQLLSAIDGAMVKSGVKLTWKTNQWDVHFIRVNIEIPLNI